MSEPVKLELEYRDDYLVIRTHGRDILERMAATMQAIADAIRVRPVRATLVDLRDLPGPVAFLDRYQLGEMSARYLGGLNIASLLKEEQVDKQRIGKLVAQNRGARIEVFTDPAAAAAWLKNTPALGSNPPVKP